MAAVSIDWQEVRRGPFKKRFQGFTSMTHVATVHVHEGDIFYFRNELTGEGKGGVATSIADAQEKVGDWVAQTLAEKGKDALKRCAWCRKRPVVTNLDNEDLCHACATKWTQAEGQAAHEREREGR